MKKTNKLLALTISLVVALTIFTPISANAENKEPEELTGIEIYDLQAPPAGALGSPIVGYKIKTYTNDGEVKANVIVVDSYWGRGLGYGLIKDVRIVLGRTYFAGISVKVIDDRYKVTNKTNMVVNGDYGNFGEFWNFRRDVAANMVSAMTNEKFKVTKGTYDGTGTWKPKRSFKSVTASSKALVYNGAVCIPKFTVKDGGKTLTEGADYFITVKDASDKVISEPKAIGKYTAVISGYGDYVDVESKVEFTIVPKGTTLSKVKAGKKSFAATWKKQTIQTAGYQIRYSTKSNMSGAKTVTISKNKTVKKTIKKLKTKKKYYIQVRTYQIVDKTKYYSAWSKKKTVKTK